MSGRNEKTPNAEADETNAGCGVFITRVFDVPARNLFEAWSKPEHLMQWFGPKGWPLTLCEMDFREGGSFRFGMTGPDGRPNTPFGGKYREIVPNRKIVFDNGFETPGAERMVVTVIFEEADGKTTLTHHTLFASEAMKQRHTSGGYVKGVGAGFDQLAELVQIQQARS